jgi:hypothetical protein
MYGFDNAADNATAHQIASKDPVRDLQGPVSLIGGDNVRLPSTLPLTALSPEMQAPILQKLQGVPPSARAATEAQLVAETLHGNSLNLRIMAGGGDNADPYTAEKLSMANEVRLLDQEWLRIETELADVVRWEPVRDPDTGEIVRDPATGEPRSVPITAVQGDRRKAMEAEARRLKAKIEDLQGRGGEHRRREAMKRAVAAENEIKRQLAEDAEAKAMGDQMNRDERIKARAEIYAKHRRSNIG